ncbi:hypothetical protein [Methanoregula sp.]|uniref:hypothetical protein n=1 Tax=Methanoregula sp. TaxID=2052170 RepID=UPI003BB17CE8
MMDLEPCYNFKDSIDCVSLLQNLPCIFVFRGKEFNSQADIIFDTEGSVDVGTEIPKDLEDPFFFWLSKHETNSIILNGQKIPAFISRIGPSPSENVSITFSPNQEPFPITGVDETPLSKVIFHLFNFKDKKGTTRKVIGSENSWYSLGVTELESRKWKVELHEIKKSDEAGNRKKHSPSLSHVCCLTRSDGSEFNGKAARQMLLDLRLFFTFSQGAFCPPVMPVGYDINDKKVWALGSSPHHPDSSMSWFDQHHSEELARLFPGFMSRLENDRWRETFQTVIYWGARSNNTHGGGIDTGIILTQIALERLAYEYSLDDPDNHGPHSFDKLPNASSKLRYLFSQIDIPLEIPHNFNEIKELSDKKGFTDAPRFLTELRNSMVHPINKQRHLFTGLYPDAWRLGMWYLELAILRLCNYEGTYVNRLADEHWVGEVEDVPWTKKSEIP